MLPAIVDLEVVADPAGTILVSCEKAKGQLARLLAGGKIEEIVELKAQAAGYCAFAKQQVQIGRDAELSVAELLRRAERCIGLAIRKGQAEGTIQKRGVANVGIPDISTLTGMTRHELSEGVYPVTDDVTDRQWEVAIREAKVEQDFSRANLVRKVAKYKKPKKRKEPKKPKKPKKAGKSNGEADKWDVLRVMAAEGSTSHQIAERMGISHTWLMAKVKELGVAIPADRVVSRIRKIDHDRVFSEFVGALESLVPSCDLIDLNRVTRKVLTERVGTMSSAMKALGSLHRRLKREVNNGS